MKPLRISLLFLMFLGTTAFSKAQTAVGSWKKTDEVLWKSNGKTTSTFKMMVKNMPCFANIVYTFSANGRVDEQSADCSASIMAMAGKGLAGSHWKMDGGQLILQSEDSSSPVRIAKYQVKFVGQDEMILTFIYSNNPGVSNFTKAKQMQTTYKRQ